MAGSRFYNYAFSGGTCSLKVASQPASVLPGQIPTVLEYGVPAFEADLAFPCLYPDRQPDNTVYAIWIGTNDLGVAGYLLDRNVPGTTLDDLVGCVYASFDRIYASGGRRFVVMNEAPLEKAPMYKSLENGGQGNNPVFKDKTRYNTTQYEHKLFHYAQATNDLFEYSAPFHLLLKRRWPGANITIFDIHSLFNNVSDSPQLYLDPPYNVASSYKVCDADNHCTPTSSWSTSSFLWVGWSCREPSPDGRGDKAAAKTFSAFRFCQRQPDLCSLITTPPATIDPGRRGALPRITRKPSPNVAELERPLFVFDNRATSILVIPSTSTRARRKTPTPPVYSFASRVHRAAPTDIRFPRDRFSLRRIQLDTRIELAEDISGF
ncbi:hypothetical protein PWT90_00846 [Aphanocladium album]|nr:hypothetical protein PWT90_00846 [Aphanocladium album]